MRGRQLNSLWARVAGAGGLGALLFTVGCGTSPNAAVSAQPLAAAQPSTPVVVSCEPNQRTLVRPALVNGAVVSQVECVTNGVTAAAVPVAVPQAPARYYTASSVGQGAEIADARIVPAAYPVGAARPVRTRQIVYDDDRQVREVRRTRSVKKSAVIIGSSAGIGAGVGAAVGGKKGALIGAAVGGGGAALWDQITRRKD